MESVSQLKVDESFLTWLVIGLQFFTINNIRLNLGSHL